MGRLAWLALLLAACSAQPTSSPTSAPSNSSTTSSLSCRLPVISGSTGQGGGPQQPGFLSLPGATFTPVTNAGDGRYYDRRLARWGEWVPWALSDDGLSYAYVEGDTASSRLHLVDLKTAKDRVLAEGGPWRVVGLQPDGVYAMRVEYLPESPAYGVLEAGRGLWKVPLDGSKAVQLTDDTKGWVYVSKGAAWASSGTLNVAGGPSDVFRLDLQTRKLTTWFAPGKRSAVLAIDTSGAPLIMIEAEFFELWRVPAPGGAVKVWSSPSDDLGPYGPAAVDGSVIWFSSHSRFPQWGIYKYSAAKGVELVAKFSDRPVTVAGPCA